MLLHRIYYETHLREGQTIELDTNARQYLLHVLRLKKNAEFIIFNGQGGEFLAKLIDAKRRSATIEILQFQKGILNPMLEIHLGQALSKGQRMDYALQKATELGISQITPLYTQNSNVQLDPSRLNNRLSHWKGIITHACAQSKRCDVPQLHTPEYFSTTSLFKNDGLKLICELNSTHHITSYPSPKKVTLLIGPEGGFTTEEIALAITNGFKIFSLGKRTLRTETATVTAMSVIQFLWGDF